MSDSKSTIIEGADGRLYEIPAEALQTFAVPGEKFEEMRQRLASDAAGSAPTDGNGIPAGHAPAPADHSIPVGHTAPAASGPAMSFQPGTGGVTLNFYFGDRPQAGNGAIASSQQADAGVEGYHFQNDESAIATLHHELLDGTYVDRNDGQTKMGVHSHHPILGNAV